MPKQNMKNGYRLYFRENQELVILGLGQIPPFSSQVDEDRFLDDSVYETLEEANDAAQVIVGLAEQLPLIERLRCAARIFTSARASERN